MDHEEGGSVSWTQEELRPWMEQERKRGNVTRTGVVYNDELVNCNGCSFLFFREDHHTDEDIASAKAEIRRDRDVVRMSIERVTGCAN
jgi:hypothetical protein